MSFNSAGMEEQETSFNNSKIINDNNNLSTIDMEEDTPKRENSFTGSNTKGTPGTQLDSSFGSLENKIEAN
jgi:hypothetical protein